ncbi:MAG TPA: cytochrome c3 family protein [Terriglobales bacterium]|nr:cytochrome c3 family protein [Terriglobales bacterium]
MAQTFHRSTNTISRFTIFGAVFFVAALLWVFAEIQRSPYTTYAGVARPQPVPFSHQHHVGGLGIDCRYCHTSVEVSSFAGIPPTKTCMNCHSQIWTNAPLLEPVRQSFRSGESLVWNRVNDLPDYVYFNHSIHVAKGVGCNTCHGPVDRMPLMYNYASLQMEWCLDCHRAPEKYLRPREQVFNMRYSPPDSLAPAELDGTKYYDQRSLGLALVKKYNLRSVHDITSCNTCHR